MGYMAHDAVVVVTFPGRPGGLPDMDAFRAELEPELARLVIGPVDSAINHYAVYAFLPDGSKEGWPLSDAADKARERFKDLFRQRYDDGSTHDDWVHARFGGEPEYGDGGSLVEVYRSESRTES